MTRSRLQLTQSLETDLRIDELCLEFLQELESGQRPDIAVYLDKVDSSARDALLYALLAEELEWRKRRNEPAELHHYLDRLADRKQVVEAAFQATDPTAVLPTSIDRFRVQEILGEGAFGVVYKAYDPRLRKTVAIKVPRWAGQNAQNRARFIREARSASRLIHPHIVRATEVVEDRDSHDRPIIVCDFVDGESLDKYLGETTLGITELAAIARDVARALHYAHSNGVIHRDIKPGNILIGPDNRPYVLDFGLAKIKDLAGWGTRTGTVLGTMWYMPPEQARGETDSVGANNDIYSLGAVLFHLLVRRPLFEGGSQEIIRRICDDTPPPIPHEIRPEIPKALSLICWQCVQKNPDDRFATAEELADALDDYVQSGGTMSVKRAPSKVVRFIQRYRTTLLILLLAVVCILLLLVIRDLSKYVDSSRSQRGRSAHTASSAGSRFAICESPVRRLVSISWHQRHL